MNTAGLNQVADLGAARRDQISALAGRGTPTNYEALLIRKRHEDRMEKTIARASENERAILAAWNDQSAFSTDETIANLPNRFNGQGHRAKLKQDMAVQKGGNHQHDEFDEEEALINQFGEERAFHMIKQRANNTYTTDVPGPADRRPSRDTTPRQLPNQGNQRGLTGQRRGPPPATNRRAYSPRAQGTVRFPPPARRAVTSPSVSSTAAASMSTPSTNTNVTTRQPPASAIIPPVRSTNFQTQPMKRPANAAENVSPLQSTKLRTPPVTGPSNATNVSQTQAANPPKSTKSGPSKATNASRTEAAGPPQIPPMTGPLIAADVSQLQAAKPPVSSVTWPSNPAATSQTPSTNSDTVKIAPTAIAATTSIATTKTQSPATQMAAPLASSDSSVVPSPKRPLSLDENEQLKMLAKNYVANPELSSANWVAKDPEYRKWLLRRSRTALVHNAVLFALDPIRKDARGYRESRKDRQWATDAANKAIEMLRNNSAVEIDAYYTQVPEHLDMLIEARKILKLEPPDEKTNSPAHVASERETVKFDPVAKKKGKALENEAHSQLSVETLANAEPPKSTSGEIKVSEAEGSQRLKDVEATKHQASRATSNKASTISPNCNPAVIISSPSDCESSTATKALTEYRGSSELIIHDFNGKQEKSDFRQFKAPYRITMSITPNAKDQIPNVLIAKLEDLHAQMDDFILRCTTSVFRQVGNAIETYDGIWEEKS